MTANSGLTDSDIKIILSILEKYKAVETAIIYGSRALGNYKKGSDIDIALKGKELTQDICSKIHYELEEETLLPYFFDITNYQMINNKEIKEHIDRVGKIFYLSGWIKTTLGEVCEIKGGKRLPKGENLVLERTNHPYIRITDLENNQIKKHQLQFVTDEVFQKISRYIVNTGDVIVSIVGSIGFVALIDEDLDNASLTENCVKFVNLKNLDSKFLYYFLISRDGQGEINKNTVGAVQKKLPIYGVQNIKISLPPLPEQQSIASVLSAFDDKIELLREQNKTLEEIGQVIFQEWFGKYSVENQEDLPDGWRVGKIEDLTMQMNSGGTPSTKEESYYNGIINWFSTKELQDNFIFQSEKKITDLGLKNSSAKLFPENTIVMAIYAAPTVGRLGILAKESTFNQAAVGLVAKDEIGCPFIYFFVMN